MVYNVDYFIKKFEAIPEEQWTTQEFVDWRGCKCALGHCGVDVISLNHNEEALTLMRLMNHRTADINDGYSLRYKQPTPKQRILAALRDVANEVF